MIVAPQGAETRVERDNNKWIDQQIKSLPHKLRTQARNNWGLVYTETFDNEPDPNYKPSRAMRAANIRLRVYVGRVNNS